MVVIHNFMPSGNKKCEKNNAADDRLQGSCRLDAILPEPSSDVENGQSKHFRLLIVENNLII